jgi:hypothetical protein
VARGIRGVSKTWRAPGVRARGHWSWIDDGDWLAKRALTAVVFFLWACKLQGVDDCMELTGRYVTDFVSMRLLSAFAMAASLSLLPLLLLKYPVTTLVEQIFSRLLGLPQ